MPHGEDISHKLGSLLTTSKVMAEEFCQTFRIDDFINLSRFNVYLKLPFDGVGSRVFSATI